MKRSHFQLEANEDTPSTFPHGAQVAPDNDQRHGSQGYIPKISRRIRACTECKRHKVRCNIQNGDSVCQRCRRMGLECIVNKTLQTLLEDETEWKTTIELAVSDLLKRAKLPGLSHYRTDHKSKELESTKEGRKGSNSSAEDAGIAIHNEQKSNSIDISTGEATGSDQSNYSFHRQPPHYALDREDTGTSSMITAPMGSLYEVAQLGDIRERSPGRSPSGLRLASDFISRGVVSPDEAEELFYYFDHVLNRYLWDGVALVHSNLISVRNSSSMLAASILAVTALHMPHKERTYDTCYAEFARLASGSMLDHNHSLDDLRALCIGAFWLADVSWKLSGYAVRIATEHNLHQCYRKALEGSPEHKEQATLWYLLYTLEHHFSIAYGRPPIIHEDQSITNHNTLITSPSAPEADLRLHTQVDLFIILTRMYHTFGPDVDLEVPESDFAAIDKFDDDLREWKATWAPRLKASPYVGTYAHKTACVHYHFSRLQLNSVALRTYHSSNSTRIMSTERKKRANLAIDSAIATLEMVLREPDIQRSLVGVPLYVHSMITFAAVFLLKIAVKGCSNITPGGNMQQHSIASANLHIDLNLVRDLVGRTATLMISCSARAGKRHLSHHISRGLRKMLAGFEEWKRRNANASNPHPVARDRVPSLFRPVILPGVQQFGEHDTILNHPPPLLGVAPLSAERSNGAEISTPALARQSGLSESSLDPMMADLWGFDEEYFPMGVFEFLQSQMPA